MKLCRHEPRCVYTFGDAGPVLSCSSVDRGRTTRGRDGDARPVYFAQVSEVDPVCNKQPRCHAPPQPVDTDATTFSPFSVVWQSLW
jgi:hypothetical protein